MGNEAADRKVEHSPLDEGSADVYDWQDNVWRRRAGSDPTEYDAVE